MRLILESYGRLQNTGWLQHTGSLNFPYKQHPTAQMGDRNAMSFLHIDYTQDELSEFRKKKNSSKMSTRGHFFRKT